MNNTIKELYPTADVIDLKYNLSIHAGGIILSTESFNQYFGKIEKTILALTKSEKLAESNDLLVGKTALAKATVSIPLFE